jgi:hypothetical protein
LLLSAITGAILVATFRGERMAIYRRLQEAAFEEAEVAQLSAAYEAVLEKLRLKNRDDPVTELIAARIIHIFRTGEHNPSKLCSRALQELGVPEAK